MSEFDSQLPDNLIVDGTLEVTGATTLTGATTMTGLANLNGGIAVDTSNFTVSGTTGAIHSAASADITGDITLNDGGNRVVKVGANATADANAAKSLFVAGGAKGAGTGNGGNLYLDGGATTGGSAGSILVGSQNGTSFVVTPNTNIVGDFTVNTNKVAVTASSGATTFAGLVTANQGVKLSATAGGGVTVLLKDSNSDALLATGTSVPADTTTAYAKGCLFIDTDVASGTSGLYVNVGTNTSCVFKLVTNA